MMTRSFRTPGASIVMALLFFSTDLIPQSAFGAPPEPDSEPATAMSFNIALPDGRGDLVVDVIPIYDDAQIPSALGRVQSEYAAFRARFPAGTVNVSSVEPEELSGDRRGASESARDLAERSVNGAAPAQREFFPVRVWNGIKAHYTGLPIPKKTFIFVRPGINCMTSLFTSLATTDLPLHLILPQALSVFAVSYTFTELSPWLTKFTGMGRLTRAVSKKFGLNQNHAWFAGALAFETALWFSPISMFFQEYGFFVRQATFHAYDAVEHYSKLTILQDMGRLLSAGALSVVTRPIWDTAYTREFVRQLSKGTRTETSRLWQFYSVQALGSAISALGSSFLASGMPETTVTIYTVQGAIGLVLVAHASNLKFREFNQSIGKYVVSGVGKSKAAALSLASFLKTKAGVCKPLMESDSTGRIRKELFEGGEERVESGGPDQSAAFAWPVSGVAG